VSEQPTNVWQGRVKSQSLAFSLTWPPLGRRDGDAEGKGIKYVMSATFSTLSFGSIALSIFTRAASRLFRDLRSSQTPACSLMSSETNWKNGKAVSEAPLTHLDEEDDDLTQDISGRNINPTKLSALLRAKFGAGAYELHVSLYETSPCQSTRC
jgi:hypothetical protein